MESSFIGNVIDHYRIIEQLGIGGMGVVFKAINININKVVALKMIAPGLALNDNFIQRFKTEAKALAKLDDFNIVSITDLRRDKDQWFIVMEYVDGINLYDKIKKDGPYSCKESIPILKQILTAIGHAHKAGIIHRDIKPNNIMVTKDGVVKITDFGLAKDQNKSTSTVSITSGGTLYYMSPEHVKGFSFTDGRSDLYSTGMTYYEMITGKVPFQNINPDFDMRERIIRKDFEKPSVYNPKIPPGLEAIVMKSIAKDPDMRYQTAEEMLAAINKFEKTFKGDRPVYTGTGKALTDSELFEDETESKKKGSFFKKVASAVVLIALLFLTYIFYPQLTGKPSLKDQAIIPVKDTTVIVQSRIPETSTPPVKQPSQTETISKKEAKPPIKKAPVFIPLSIRSIPSRAEVYLNGRLKGKTPLQLKNLKKGQYRLNISKKGFAEYSKRLVLSEGQKNSINAHLAALTGGLTVSVIPQDAQIYIDGEAVSKSKLSRLSTGQHFIEIKKDGFATHKEKIEIEHRTAKNISVTLVPLKGTLSVQVLPWGSIYIDNKLRQAETDIKYVETLTTGEHTIKVIHPTFGVWEKTVPLKASGTSAVVVDFNETRAVKINAVDEQGYSLSAAVFVDNKDTGHRTPGAVTVRIGTRTISVKKEGYRAVTGTVKLMIDNRFNEEQTFIMKKVK